MSAEPELYFRQILAGRQVALVHPVAGQLANFMYLIGDPQSREALVVDPAWDVRGLIDLAAEDGYEVVGVLATHNHPDHVGGDLYGLPVEGVADLLEQVAVPIYVHKQDAEGMRRLTGVSASDQRQVDAGDTITLGAHQIRCLHTPGHSPGSQCFLIGNRLVAGDTLFVQGCGRVDLPGSDPDAMYHSLTGQLAKLPAETQLFPGHDYGPAPTSTIGDELRQNYYLRIQSLADWRRLMGPL